ncbi:hypothetical protein [Anabaena azotica]|uniref:hypothetical protein n=1 Tax=Anabaena azotica TaxID=197653 RepID=UPI0039A6F157
MSSFRLALNDPTFALNSLLKLDPKVDPQLLEEVGHLGCKDAASLIASGGCSAIAMICKNVKLIFLY